LGNRRGIDFGEIREMNEKRVDKHRAGRTWQKTHEITPISAGFNTISFVLNGVMK
jgi:hypothetical protein